MDSKWSECRELIRKLKNCFFFFWESPHQPHPADKFLHWFGHPYDFLVVMDNWTTANMDPCKPEPLLTNYSIYHLHSCQVCMYIIIKVLLDITVNTSKIYIQTFYIESLENNYWSKRLFSKILGVDPDSHPQLIASFFTIHVHYWCVFPSYSRSTIAKFPVNRYPSYHLKWILKLHLKCNWTVLSYCIWVTRWKLRSSRSLNFQIGLNIG